MNKTVYTDKLNHIVQDNTKFVHITRSPLLELKRELNGLIRDANSYTPVKYFDIVQGDFAEGYLYGNVKIHKNNNPLRPIISQVLTPTYEVAKKLDKLVKPYMPANYNIKSRDDFLNILHSTKARGELLSLDVESLFTNVPVVDTIEIIVKNVYGHPSIPPPLFPREILRNLLLLCTTKVPFRHINGKQYLQKDGVSMGSPLGPTFADFYMCDLENRVFPSILDKPDIYVRYVDDVFMVTTQEKLNKIMSTFESNSVLKFTHECSINGKIPFLDVLVENLNNGEFATSVYTKPTSVDNCILHADSECPERYKINVLNNYLKRAYKVSSDWDKFIQESQRIKQTLINNGYTNTFVDKHTRSFLSKVNASLHSNSNTVTKQLGVAKEVFYLNQMSSGYKADEVALRKIFNQNVRVVSPNNNLKLVIYYKNLKSCNLVMCNNPSGRVVRTVSKSNLIYEFKCPRVECTRLNNIRYIGETSCTLSRRLSQHLQHGAIKEHFEKEHNCRPTRVDLVDNTKIRYIERDHQRLLTLESLIIKFENPIINQQDTGFSRVLHLFH